jgi:hypothetical protein
VATKEDWHFHLNLHAATPLAHAQQARLCVNGEEIALTVTVTAQDHVKSLRGRIRGSVLKKSTTVWHEFQLTAPVTKLGAEIRKIGICLRSMELKPVSVHIPMQTADESSPLISVIIPTKNAAPLVEETIRSILSQGDEALLECLLQDGGSTDGTMASACALGPRVQCVQEPDSFIYEGLNRALARCRGRWILILGAGDRLRPGVMKALISKLESFSQPALVYGDVWMEDLQERYAGVFQLRDLAEKNVCQQAIFYHRSVFENLGGFDLNYPVLADYAFNLRCFGDHHILREHVDMIIADYKGGGLSATVEDAYFKSDKAALVARHLKL